MCGFWNRQIMLTLISSFLMILTKQNFIYLNEDKIETKRLLNFVNIFLNQNKK